MITTEHINKFLNNDAAIMKSWGNWLSKKLHGIVNYHNNKCREHIEYEDVLTALWMASLESPYESAITIYKQIRYRFKHKRYTRAVIDKNEKTNQVWDNDLLEKIVKKHERDFTCPTIYVLDFVEYVKRVNKNAHELLILELYDHTSKPEWARKRNVSVRRIQQMEAKIRQLYVFYSAI